MSQGMPFDYNAPAELFLAKRTKNSREKYRRFATAAEAIRYAVETLRTPKAFGAWLQVGDERFGGFVAKYMGDGVLVYFGYPQAHEDDAERAVRAGLELVAAVSGSEDPRGPANPRRHRNGACGRRRPDRLGRFSGASNRRRDAEPCRTLAGHCGAEQRRDCGKHSEARGQSVRA